MGDDKHWRKAKPGPSLKSGTQANRNADIVGQLLHTMNNFNAGIMPAIVPLKTLVPNYHFLIIHFSDPSLITILDHLSPLGHCLVCLCTTNIFPQLTMRKYHY